MSRQNAVLRKEIARLQAYRAMAYRDPLTGLWNRRYFEERLKEEISRSQRAGSSRKFSVLVVDINDFKEINDTHGHQMGDRLLKWVGVFLTDHLRTHDVPCRTGGDEFTVLLPDLSSEDCGRIITRLRDQLQVANAGRDIPVRVEPGHRQLARGGHRGRGADRERGRGDVRRQAAPEGREGHRRVGHVAGREGDRGSSGPVGVDRVGRTAR